MDKRKRIVRTGPFRGKKIELASTDGVDRLRRLAEEFMESIFEMEPGSYLITDESSLRDFEGVEDMDLLAVYEKVRSVFGVEVSDIRSGNLVEIFARIHRHRRADADR